MSTRGGWLAGLGLAFAVATEATAAAPDPPTDPVAASPPAAPKVLAPRLDRPAPHSAGVASANGLGLRRQTDGRYVYVDPGRRFSARIEPNGSVRFADRWRRIDDRARRRKSARGRAGGTPPEGFLRATDPFGGAAVTGPSEWALRARGHDPAAAAKAAWLARTEGFRARLALGWHRDQLRERLAGLPDRLAALWSDASRPVAERRAKIFAQWDECAEPIEVGATTPRTATTIDRERAAAARVARDVIEQFVRRELPAGSSEAYSAAELARLNAGRESDAAFTPYADPAPAPQGDPS